jgi:tetratricopeptide (TPR) repeat protein
MAKKDRLIEAEVHLEEEQQGDFEAFLDHIKENPLLYVVGTVFIVICALAGVSYRLYSDGVERNGNAEYARALDIEDPLKQAESLARVAEGGTAVSAEALYLSGEMAFRGSDLEKAEAAFTRLREEFPDFEFTPDAIEGLGYIEEDAGNYGEAITKYQKVLDKFPGSFAGRRQSFNIGRSSERAGEIQEAIDAYRDQLTAFPESNVARRAQNALNRLRESNSDLFSEEVAGTDSELLSTLESAFESVETTSAEDSTSEELAETADEAPAETTAEGVTPEDPTEAEAVDTDASAADATASEDDSPASEPEVSVEPSETR